MVTITLKRELHESLESAAEKEDRSVDDLVNEAVRCYLRDREVAKIDRELEAYEAMHPELRQKYFDRWVAIHDGQLVDHDDDGALLHRRILAQYGRTPVLIQRVTQSPIEEIWWRSPRLDDPVG